MRIDPISKEKFEPNNPNHIFSSQDSFLKFIETYDPLDEFAPEKREINWTPQKRKDPLTGEEFWAEHPAQRYAPKDEEDEGNQETE